MVVGLQELLPLFIWFAWRRTAVPLASSSVPVGRVLFVGTVACTCCLSVLCACVQHLFCSSLVIILLLVSSVSVAQVVLADPVSEAYVGISMVLHGGS